MSSQGMQIYFRDFVEPTSPFDISLLEMGSISLVCPMCCGETFSNSESLKCHLQSMADNLFCPGCSTRTYSIAALIQHLDVCEKVLEQEGHKNNAYEFEAANVKNNSINENDALSASFLETVNDSEIMIVGEGRTIQVDENGDIKVVENSSIVTGKESSNQNDELVDNETQSMKTVFLKPDASVSEMLDFTDVDKDGLDEDMERDPIDQEGISDNENSTDRGDEEKAETTMYTCSTCEMSFESVIDHVTKYHGGQEVVIETEDQEMTTVRIEEESELPTFDQAKKAAANKVLKQKQSMNTLRTEECIDSDGRLYTRKVVQIERFWDRTPVTLASTKAPMIEKFFSNVEGVKVRDKSVTVAPTQMYRCNQCLEQFAKLTDFRVHACKQGSHQCQVCDQTFGSTKALQSHMKTHEVSSLMPQKIFNCAICGTEFITHKSLRLHSRMHLPVKSRHVDAPEGTDEENFTCKECGKVLSESYRVAHLALHAGDSITCVICNRKFDSAESLEMHKAVHSYENTSNHMDPSNAAVASLTNELMDTGDPNDPLMERQLPCTSAALAAKNEEEDSDLQNQKPYQCQHCGRRFTRPHEKVKHERIHTGEKPHACEVCGKKFRVSYCLTLHMRTHTGVRPYECHHCGKRFKASSVYNHHLLTHSDERAYKCPYCPKTFKTRVQLAGHKNSHTKPFRCTECSRPFASLYAARAHMQTHKKDNNLKFCCEICGASYGRQFALKDHMKQHEQEGITLPLEAAREEEVPPDFLLQAEDDETAELIVPDCTTPHCESVTIEIGNDV